MKTFTLCVTGSTQGAYCSAYMGSPCTRINIEHVTLNMNIKKKEKQTDKQVSKKNLKAG